MSEALGRLAAELRAEGGLLASAARDPAPQAQAQLGPLAASGPRTRDRAGDYELLVEAVREGYLLHYGAPRVMAPADADLALLAGDELYARGLARLAALGDVDAVRELADVVSLAARAQAAGEPELAEAVWEAGAAAIGWGSTPEHERAKALARRGDPGAAEALRLCGQARL